jgi:hypothetical protein
VGRSFLVTLRRRRLKMFGGNTVTSVTAVEYLKDPEAFIMIGTQITFSDILNSAADLALGRIPQGNFREARGWRVEIGGCLFPHRPLIALAAEQYAGRELEPCDFNGNNDKWCKWWLGEVLGFHTPDA